MSGHFQNDEVVQPSICFRRYLSIEYIENTIGVNVFENGQPKRNSKISIYVPCEKITVKHYGRMWDPSKKRKSETKISKAVMSELFRCDKNTRLYFKCSKGIFLCSGCFADHKV